MPRRGTAALLAAGCLAGCLTGCVSSSRTDRDYERKAAHTAESAVSEIRTVEIAVSAAVQGRTTWPYLSVVVGDALSALSSIGQTFSSVQPPSTRADALRDELTTTLTEATDAVEQVLIWARRSDPRRLAAASSPLEEQAAELERFAEEHS